MRGHRVSYRSCWSWTLAIILGLTPSLAVAADAPQPETKPATPAVAGPAKELTPEERTALLAKRQKQLLEKLELLEKQLGRRATLDAGANPKRAEILKQAIGRVQDGNLHKRMDDIVQRIAGDELGSAVSDQEAVVKDLKVLLDLLLKEDRNSRNKSEQARIKDYIKEVERRLREESDIIGRTEGGDDLKRLEGEQAKNAERTAELAKRMMENEENQGSSKSGKPNDPKDGTDKKNGKPGDNKESKPGDNKESKPGDNKESKPGDNKESKPGDNKESKPGDNKESKPGDNKESKPGDSKESKPGDSKESKPGDSKESKPGDSKESKPGDSKESKPGDSKESKPGDNKESKLGDDKKTPASDPKKDKSDDKSGKPGGKPTPGKPQPGQPNQPPPDGEPSDSKDQSPPPKQDDGYPPRKRIQAAEDKMRKAQQKLEKANRKEAAQEQEQAREELAKAKAELEEILRQLREEEVERTLAALEGRFRKMLEMQLRVYEETKKLSKLPPVDRKQSTYDDDSRKLSFDERKIVVEADKALTLLQEEGSSITFPEIVDQMRKDMEGIVVFLNGGPEGTEEPRTDRITQGLEEDVIAALSEMIEALQKAQRDLEQKRKQPPSQSQQGQPQDQPLVDKIAELKALKSLQIRVNNRTSRYAKLLEHPEDLSGQATEDRLIRDLKELAHREANIYEITRGLHLGKNK